MEKKTIGQFIAILRKANGMTQKQLAEQLNVSDKAISRWERDESAPDLSLIPVLAEIFGVTSDELLRGERTSPETALQVVVSSPRSQKQLQHLLHQAKTRFQIQSTITVGIAFAGLIAALICNFGFLRAYIGFFTACVFYLAAAVCQAVFTITAKSSLENSELEEAAERNQQFYRQLTFKIGALIFILFAATLPLLMSWDAYTGLTGTSWLIYGLICAGIAAVFSIIIYWRFTAHTVSKALSHLRRKTLFMLTALLSVTMIAQIIFNSVVSVKDMAYAETHTWEAFKEYIETPMEYDGSTANINSDIEYFDSNNQPISAEEFYTQEIYDPSGNVAHTYLHYNQTVSVIEYRWEGEELILSTISQFAYNSAIQMHQRINFLFGSLYFVEFGIMCILYIKKKQNL